MGRTSAIVVERPDERRLQALGVTGWPIWEKEPSVFDWCYGEPETCYFLEGEVVVKAAGVDTSIRQGDLVTFPQGLRCTWHVRKTVHKRYRVGVGR